MPFVFKNDGRPRAASKQLHAALTEISVKSSLKECRDLVARMAGYANWRSMSDAFGESPSLDDAMVSNKEREQRTALQHNVLIQHGLTASQAEMIRTRLSLTDRTGMEGAESDLLPLLNHIYHPNRLLNWTQDLMGNQPFFYNQAQSQIEDWMDKNTISPIDALGYTMFSFDEIFTMATDVVDKTGWILDASAVALQLSKLPLPASISDAQSPREDGTLFVHFGDNVFPSPFPGCWIDGCYVTYESPSENGNYRGVNLCFVVSTEGYENHYTHDMICRDKRQSVVETMRHIELSAQAPEDDPYGPVAPSFGFYSEGGEGYEDVWMPFLTGPIAAAVHALDHERKATLPISMAVAEDATPEELRAIVRAKNRSRLHRVFANLASEGILTVKFLERPNPLVVDIPDENPPLEVDVPVLAKPFGDAEEWYLYYLSRAEQATDYAMPLAHAKLRFTGYALAMLPYLDEYQREEFAEKPLLIRAEGLISEGMFEQARSLLQQVVRSEDDDYGLADRIAALTVAAKDDRGARLLLAELGGADDIRSTWKRALLLSYLEGGDVAQEAIDLAVSMDRDLVDDIEEAIENGCSTIGSIYPGENMIDEDIIAVTQWEAWREIGGLELLRKATQTLTH